MAFLHHDGIGTERMRPPLPTRSTSNRRLSRCWMWLNSMFDTSVRRKAAADQHRQQGEVTITLQRSGFWRVQYRLCLFFRQPIGNPDAGALDPFNPADPMG